MSVTTRWFPEDDSIIYVRYDDQWTWEDFYHAVNVCRQMMQHTVRTRVDIIAHLASAHVPGGHHDRHAEQAVKSPSPRLGVIVVIAENRIVRSVITFAIRLNPHSRRYYRVTASLPEARRLIASLRDQDTVSSVSG